MFLSGLGLHGMVEGTPREDTEGSMRPKQITASLCPWRKEASPSQEPAGHIPSTTQGDLLTRHLS